MGTILTHHCITYNESYTCGNHTTVLKSDFWWPTLFRDVREFVLTCDRCQRMGNILKKHEMPLKGILEVELFDV